MAIYGGSAGCGKTFAGLLMLANPNALELPKYRAVVFRNSYPEISAPGAIWDESQDLYREIGGRPNNSKYSWQFPSGAQVRMSYLARKSDAYSWKGAQVDLILFEELTEFKRDGEDIFWYLLSRARTRAGLSPKIRATTNPDADSWVRQLIDWWIGSDGYPIPDRSGEIRWVIRRGEELEWGDTREELIRDPDDDPKSFTFIAGLVGDNPKLLEINPGYIGNLKSQHPVEMERLLKGNWNIRFERGEIYRASWFVTLRDDEDLPNPIAYWVRFWDLAGTPRGVSRSAYYTAGVLMGVTREEEFLVEDVIWTQVSAGEIPDLMLQTGEGDGTDTIIAWEREPATGGLFFSQEAKKRLSRFTAVAVAPKDSKRARAIPYAAQAKNGKVWLAQSKWNQTYRQSLEAFDGTPEPLIADLSDASAGAYKYLKTLLNRDRSTPVTSVGRLY